ncbi:PD-(D/E)XK nuclease family protein [Paraburkholderia bannensis]|uniref:PD-(D/E)XK nuclease family protein n=1 Tax=Paraburkholderia bannensis TaxID=765414 RepID=UPI002ABE4906|nr:PD-(D/E)XK nuclease family protein [Paraburkholderia bannensis]
MRPNLFKYATSELSQDAFICWLLDAADSKYQNACPELCALGQAFLSLIFSRHTDAPAPERIETVEIHRQKARIDILCWVNRDIVIVIEDKVGTEQSPGQLRRYKAHAETGLKQPVSRRLHAYIQTGDQSDYSPVLLDGYSVLRRSDLLELFESELGTRARATSHILDDFASRLRHIENLVQSYKTTPIRNWGGRARIGFVSRLKEELGGGQWAYVHNGAGGFYGFFGKRVPVAGCKVYLQVEMSPKENKLCFKIDVMEQNQQKHLRDLWHSKLIGESGRQDVSIVRPGRLLTGKTMTVAKRGKPFPITDELGCIDIARTVELLRECQAIIETCARVDSTPGPQVDLMTSKMGADACLSQGQVPSTRAADEHEGISG